MREFELQAKLAERLGEDAARVAVEVIIAEWGGCRLDIPTGTQSRTRRRNREIRQMRAAGADFGAIQSRFGLSDRHVRRILSGTH